MKYLLPVLTILPLFSNAQALVSDQPQERTLLLEEYTAINCGNCPAAHVLAENLISAHPGSLTALEVHGGGLAVPNGGQLDFRTSWGTALWSHYGVNSQPRGAINRIPVSGQTVVSTSAWTNAVNNALALPSPVNIGLSSEFDAGPRTLNVNVELFYTADSPEGNDRITVLLKENHLIGYQQDYVNGAQANYDHKNVLRDYITDLWGDEVTTTTTGSFVTRSYTFSVPEEWDIANCDVVAFVSEYQGEIYQARSIIADGGFTTSIADDRVSSLPSPYPVPANERVFIPLPADGSQALVRITDDLGREIRSVRATSGLLEMDVRSWPTGVYSYSITSPAGLRNGRFVVQR